MRNRNTDATILRPLSRTAKKTDVFPGAPCRRDQGHGLAVVVRSLAALLALGSVLLGLSVSWQGRSEAITSPLLFGRYDAAHLEALATDGNVAAFVRSTGDTRALVIRSLDGPEERVLTVTPGRIDVVTLSGDLVAWQERDCDQCPARVQVRRWTDGQEVLSARTNDERTPVLWQRWLAWVSRNGHDRVYAADLSGTQRTVDVALVGDSASAIRAIALHEGRLFWLDSSPDGRWRISVQPIASAADATTLLTGSGPAPAFRVVGDTLITITDVLTARNALGSGQPIELGRAQSPELVTADDRYLFWLDPSPAGQSEPALVAFDTQSGSRFIALPEAGAVDALAAGGGWLIWAERTAAGSMLWGAPLADLLPTARRSQPQGSDPRWRYVPETGHYLANGFRQFWERYGGVEIFGYPISEEFDEFDPQTGQFRTVQYFERARFVWAPAEAAALDGVVLDRLGAELAERLALTHTRAFRVPAAAPFSQVECRRFDATGHLLCGGFLAAWQRTGELVRQQSALTDEEAAVRFAGFPISEPIALADGTIVQYLERARLEYRKTADGSGIVERGRIGAELLRERGWLPEG